MMKVKVQNMLLMMMMMLVMMMATATIIATMRLSSSLSEKLYRTALTVDALLPPFVLGALNFVANSAFYRDHQCRYHYS